MRFLVVLIALGLVAWVPMAQAAVDNETPRSSASDRIAPVPDEESVGTPDDLRHSAVYTIIGLGTPVGLVGIEGVHCFTSWFELSAGVGEGLGALGAGRSNLGALQWSVMPRLRAGKGRTALTFGAGISGGNWGFPPLGTQCDSCDASYATRYVVWANLEIGVETWRGAFAFRAFGGFGLGIALAAGIPFPYAGVGIGYAF